VRDDDLGPARDEKRLGWRRGQRKNDRSEDVLDYADVDLSELAELI